MAVDRATLTGIQGDAQDRASAYLQKAKAAETAREAADWALAAKNSIHVALFVEQIVKTRNAR